jgi:outer membrane protein assembly factor BamB
LTKLFYFLFLIIPTFLFSQDIWEIALPGEVIGNIAEDKYGNIVLICRDRRLYKINSTNGEIFWNQRPGGHLVDVEISPDGSIILLTDSEIISYYSTGIIRWRIAINKNSLSFLEINLFGDILGSDDNGEYIISRFGDKKYVFNTGYKKHFFYENYLFLGSTNNTIVLFNIKREESWSLEMDSSPVDILILGEQIYIYLENKDLITINKDGKIINRKPKYNFNSKLSLNVENQIISPEIQNSIVLSGGGLLTYGSDWHLKLTKITEFEAIKYESSMNNLKKLNLGDK